MPMAGFEEPILLDQEVEGEFGSTADLLFFRIGASVSLKPSDSRFDPVDPPQRPLAVCEKFGLMFVIHSEGFLVTKMRDLIKLAKEIKELVKVEKEKKVQKGQKRPTVQEASFSDVKIGKVSILALSMDSSVLAATVGGEIHLFSVLSLIKKSQNPLVSCSLGKTGSIRDLQWCKNQEKYFIVLLTCGSLLWGNMNGHLKEVEEKVDAVDWSTEGNLLAIAKDNTLRILSEKFETQVMMNFPFESKDAIADAGSQTKVDSIKWITCSSIIVGCIQHDADGLERNYFVQVIASDKEDFTASAKPVVVSFTELFSGMGYQISSGGPHLLANYLEHWKLAVLANRRNADNHVVLLELHGGDDSRKAIALELEEENYTPRIELQENGDENFVLGLDVDKVSLYEKLTLVKEDQVSELTPHCILVCLTIEGKIVLFHVAKNTDPPNPLSVFHEVDISNIQEENSFVVFPTPNEPPLPVSNFKNEKQISFAFDAKQDKKVSSSVEQKKSSQGLAFSTVDVQLAVTSSSRIPDTSSSRIPDQVYGTSLRGFSSVQPSIPISELGSVLPDKPVVQSYVSFGKPNVQIGADLPGKPGVPSSVKFGKPSIQNFQAGVPGTNILTPSFHSSTSEASGTKQRSEGDFGRVGGPSISWASSSHTQGLSLGSRSLGKSLFPEAVSANVPLPSLSATIDAEDHNEVKVQFSSSRNFTRHETVGCRTSTRVDKDDTAQGRLLDVPTLPLLGDHRAQKTSQTLNSSSEPMEHSDNVNEMVKELDRLLLEIEVEGGLADNCTSYLHSSVLALEKGLESLSGKSRTCKEAIAELVTMVQLLQDKMVQVSAREGYMKDVIKQAFNNQYWDVWSRQKLGPEFELKQQQILKLHLGLRNQLIELERHFHILELNKFGEHIGASKSFREMSTSESLRRIQTVHRLHNTVVSQLLVAEHLSDCLAGQMAALNIVSPAARQHKIAKDVLESIGVTCHSDSFISPDVKGTSLSSISSAKHPLDLSCNLYKESGKKNKSNIMKVVEPESGRRRRDSLDRSLACFEPQKTTVKRSMPHENSKMSADFSSRATGESFSRIADLQQTYGESFAFPSQPFIYKSDSKTALSGKDSREEILNPGFGTPSGFTSKRIGLPLSTQSAVEIQSWRAPDMQVMQTSNVISPSPQVPSKQSGGVAKKKDIPGLPGNSSSKPSYTSMPNVFPVSNSPGVNSSLSNVGKSTINETPKKFPNMIPENFQSLETGGKSQLGILGITSGDVPSTSTTAVLSNQDTAIMRGPGTFSFLPTTDKDNAAKVNAPANKSLPVVISNSSQALTTLIPSNASSSSPISLFSATMPAQTKASTVASVSLFNASIRSSDAKQPSTSAVPSLSSIASIPISLPIEHNASLSSDTRASEQSSVTQGVITSSLTSTPSVPISSDFTVSTNNQFSAASSSTSSFTSFSSFSSMPTVESSAAPLVSVSSMPTGESSSAPLVSSNTVKEKEQNLIHDDMLEDQMEEEAPNGSSFLNLGDLGGFGLGSPPTSSVPKSNPFGVSFGSTSPLSSSFSASTSPGQLFKPASFSIPSIQTSQPMSSTSVSGSFGLFGQPAQVNAGQQALGSVLGSFGQSRQVGLGPGFTFASGGFGATSTAASPGSNFSPSGFAGTATGGFAAAGGFASAATGGGFAAVASASGGFAGAGSGGGFAAAATGGGFASLASSSGGFPGVGSGGGFAASASGGGGFGGVNPGVFGSGSGANKPPAELLMKMRK